MTKINYRSIFKASIPIGILLFFILLSELRIEGSFGGLVDAFKYLFFLIFGIVIFIYTIINQGKKIKRKKEIKESKIILTILLLSTFVAISSFWFPKDFFDKEPEFIASGDFGTKLTLFDGKFMLRTYDYEWTNIERGQYYVENNIIYLDNVKKEKRWQKRTNKYLIKNTKLIPIYSNGIEKDSTVFLKIILNKKN